MSRFVSAVLIGISLGASFQILQAQKQSSVWDGIYSVAQAARGESAYAKNCASCHGAKLEGRNQASPLSGEEFTMNWNGASVGDLLDKIQTTMPGDRPGALSQGENAEILAYILKANQFPAGDSDLPSDAAKLKQVRFEAKRP